jgi:hypothetical protein
MKDKVNDIGTEAEISSDNDENVPALLKLPFMKKAMQKQKQQNILLHNKTIEDLSQLKGALSKHFM